MARRSASLVQKTSASRRLVTLFALLAFFIQSFALQTHVHSTPLPPASVATAAHTPAPAPLQNRDPIDQCRLCQELVHAGTFVTPSTATTAAVLTFVVASFVAPLILAGDPATAFAWQSRAPPRR